jgi:hypothetical protein
VASLSIDYSTFREINEREREREGIDTFPLKMCMVHAHAAYLAFITHLTLANNKINKFNSHVLQQHI